MAAAERAPFDKKLYRLKKYSKRYKLEREETVRRKRVLGQFYRQLDKDPSEAARKPFDFDHEEREKEEEPKEGDDRVEDGASAPGRYVTHPDRARAPSREGPRARAEREMRRLAEAKRAKKEAYVKAKEERKRALELYRQRKSDKFKRLSKKTRTGQPLMRDRMAMLLDEVQKIREAT